MTAAGSRFRARRKKSRLFAAGGDRPGAVRALEVLLMFGHSTAPAEVAPAFPGGPQSQPRPSKDVFVTASAAWNNGTCRRP
jgi:hypothetical protein